MWTPDVPTPRPSAAMEDYLKAIHALGGATDRPVGTSELAAAMRVAARAATNMGKTLATLGLVNHTHYHGVRLTLAGERIALEVIRRHRLIERYLQEVLGYGWDEVHDEADRLEHVISERLEERMAVAMGNPTTDPHGDPIPSREGAFAAAPLAPLATLRPGERAVIGRVASADPEKLRYLAAQGLVPGATVEILERAPFGGLVRLRVGADERTVGPTIESNVLVDV